MNSQWLAFGPASKRKTNTMDTKDVKRIFDQHKNDLAFVIGNGINLHYKNDNLSWKDLLLDLWGRYSSDKLTSIPEGISFTEFFDALEIQNTQTKNLSTLLQKEVQAKMKDWQPDQRQNLILNKIRDLNAPVLTTNFDDLIPKSMGLEFRKMQGTKFTDFYPWSCYYGDRELANPADGFGVWYPNGMMKYHRSIKLGLSQYMGNVDRARKFISLDPKNIYASSHEGTAWVGALSWLHIVFSKSLCIFGLGLDQTEVFFRWLLIERAKYFQNFPEHKQNGWHITRRNQNDSTLTGKKFFLKSVGFEVIELDSYEDVYEGMWG